MLVQDVIGFIREAEKIKILDERDKNLIQNIYNYFLELDLDKEISDSQINVIKDIINSRFHRILDGIDDITFKPNSKVNTLFIELLKKVSIYTKSPLVNLLFPMIEHGYDLVSFRSINFQYPINCLARLILSEDNTHLIDIQSLIRSVVGNKISTRAVYLEDFSFFPKTNRVFAPYIGLNNPSLRPFSVRELLRIRRKNLNKKMSCMLSKKTTGEKKDYENFWQYLEERIIPKWSSKGKVLLQLVRPLLQIIDCYYSDTPIFQQQLLSWSKILLIYPVHDVYHLYAKHLFVNGEKTYFINVILDCLEKKPDELEAHIQGLAQFLINCNASYIVKNKKFLTLYNERNIDTAFTVEELKRRVIALNLNNAIQLEEIVCSLLELLNQATQIDVFILEKLEQLYSQYIEEIGKNNMERSWVRLAQWLDPILVEMNYYALLRPISIPSFAQLNRIRQQYGSVYYSLFNRTYEHFSGFLTQYAAPKWTQFDEIPRHVLPLLLELVDVYFEKPINSFRKELNAWMNDLQNSSVCAINDVHYFFRQSIQYNDQLIYVFDALLILLYDDDSTRRNDAIFALARWLCRYDKSYIAKHEAFLPIYHHAHLGIYFDTQQLSKMIAFLQEGVISPVESSQLAQLQHLISQKRVIDQEIIHIIQIIYKNRDLSKLTSQWIDVVAALSGARFIPANYYCWLGMDEFDLVKREPSIDYPLSHYVTSEGKFILLDNCAEQYRVHRKAGETSLESFKLHNCNSELRVPLTPDERCQILQSNKKFHKYFYLTNRHYCVDEPICLATLDALSNLVNQSLYPIGTLFAASYNFNQQTAAENAYEAFGIFYNEMDSDERVRLDNQIICFNGMHKSFKQVLSDVNEYQCIATSGLFILQLIVDYLPDREFATHIEHGHKASVLGSLGHVSIDIKQMRDKSKRKTGRDFDFVTTTQYGLTDSTITESSSGARLRGNSFSDFLKFMFSSKEAVTPATKPQNAAPIPKKDNPEEATKRVIILGSR